MDILKGALGSCTETNATSTVDVNEATGVETVRVTDIKQEEDQEARTIPVIKTEPNESGVPAVSVTQISCTLYTELPAPISLCPCETKIWL
jgi:hypothetical protein